MKREQQVISVFKCNLLPLQLIIYLYKCKKT